MSEDFLGLNDPDEQRTAKGPAFITGQPTGGHELQARDAMWCNAANPEFSGNVHTWEASVGLGPPRKFRDLSRVIFTTTDETTGAEIWTEGVDAETGKPEGEGERWRKILGWPIGTEPSPDQVRQWKQNADARLMAKWLPRLRAAREQDRLASIGEADPG